MEVIKVGRDTKHDSLFETVVYQYSENVSLGLISLLEHNYKHTINSNAKTEVRKTSDGLLSISIAVDLKDYGEFKASAAIPLIAVKTLEWACDSFISIIGKNICNYEGVEAAMSLEKKQECSDQMRQFLNDVQSNWFTESVGEDAMKEVYKVFCHDAMAELEDLGISGSMKFHLSLKKVFDYSADDGDSLDNEVMKIAGNRIYLTLHRVIERDGNIVSVFPMFVPYDENIMKVPFADAMANALESDNELVQSLMRMQDPKGDFYGALVSFGLFGQEDAEKFTVFDCSWSEVKNIAMFMKTWKEELKAARPGVKKFCIANTDERLIVVDAKDEALLLKYLEQGYDSSIDGKMYYYNAVNELYSSKDIS